MREGLRPRKSTRVQDVNITPLIDMVFILLIFFIVTTSFVRETGIEVQRPSAQTAVAEDRTSLLIGVDPSGDIYIAGDRIDLRMVRTRVARFLARNPEGGVVVVADQSVSTGLLIQALDECRRAGATNLSVAAQLPEP